MTAVDNITKLSVMRDAIKLTFKQLSGETKGKLEEDETLQLAVVKLLENLGRASYRVSDDCKQRHSQIPWESLVDIGERLSAPYFGVNTDILWKTFQNDLEPLLIAVETAIEAEKEA